MNTGLGITEMALIVILILVFFGSKELPRLLREIGRFTAKVRRYSDRIKRELDSVAHSVDEPSVKPFEKERARKKELRALFDGARKQLTEEQRQEKSALIMQHLKASDQFAQATMIMLYVDMGAEVITRPFITELLTAGKRVVLPYCTPGTREMSIAEIYSVETDLVLSKYGVPEPKKELRKRCFKSDIDVIVCPGVAFDLRGGRLGWGMAYYDTFLQELRGKVPCVGVAFSCQITQEQLPFEYHDVSMDAVITETGVVVGRAPESPSA